MVISLRRRATKQAARKGTSHKGFAPRAQRHCCVPCQWPTRKGRQNVRRHLLKTSLAFDAARAAPLMPVDAETRFMRDGEIGSEVNYLES